MMCCHYLQGMTVQWQLGNGQTKELVSASIVCQYLKIHRRLIQNLVKQERLSMYRGLLDLDEVLQLFPNLERLRVLN